MTKEEAVQKVVAFVQFVTDANLLGASWIGTYFVGLVSLPESVMCVTPLDLCSSLCACVRRTPSDGMQNMLSDILAQQTMAATSEHGANSVGVNNEAIMVGGQQQQQQQEQIMGLGSLFRNRLMVKVFGMNGRPDLATDLLRQQLLSRDGDDDNDTVPSIAVWNSVLDAWAESAPSQPNAVEEAFAVWELLQSDPRCQQAGIRPNIATFGCLFKVRLTAILWLAGWPAYLSARKSNGRRTFRSLNRALVLCFLRSVWQCQKAAKPERGLKRFWMKWSVAGGVGKST